MATYDEAQAAYEAGDLERARALLAPLAQASPRDPRVLFALGACELGLHRPAQAEAAFRHALAADPHHTLAADRLALALEQQGRSAEADAVRAQAAALERRRAHQAAVRQRPGGAGRALGLATGIGTILAVVFAVAVLGFIGWVAYGIVGPERSAPSPFESCVEAFGSEERCRGLPR